MKNNRNNKSTESNTTTMEAVNKKLREDEKLMVDQDAAGLTESTVDANVIDSDEDGMPIDPVNVEETAPVENKVEEMASVQADTEAPIVDDETEDTVDEDKIAADKKLQDNKELQEAVDEDEATEQANAAQEKANEINATSISDILFNDDMSDTEKWANIMKLASSKIDESLITDLSLLSDAEIMRRLRLLWSKRVAAKKVNDITALQSIADAEAELQSYRGPRSSRRAGVVSSDVDPKTLSQENLNKLIRNVQSKKCTAKKAGLLEEVAVHQAEEDKLKLLRVNDPNAIKGQSAMTTRILDTIKALEALPMSAEIIAQITLLKTLA